MVCGSVLWGAQANGREVLRFDMPPKVAATSRLEVSGYNPSEHPQILVVRIDDQWRPAYVDRVNLERTVPPGDFALSLPLEGLTTPSGRSFDSDKIKQVIVFSGSDVSLRLDRVEMSGDRALPAGAQGWDLGPRGSPIWPGFQSIDLDFPGLQGVQLKAYDRGRRQQATEGLTTDGIRGIDKLVLPLKQGQWRITLWLQNRGEWEYLPHPLKRDVRINGRPIWSLDYASPQDWIEDVYLGRLDDEYRPGDDVWRTFGCQCEGRVTAVVDVAEEGLVIELSGDGPEAGYLAAVLAEPALGPDVVGQVETERADWWRRNWPVAESTADQVTAPSLRASQEKLIVAPGTTAVAKFELRLPAAGPAPIVDIAAPALGDIRLTTRLRWGRWQLRRKTLSASLLEPVNGHLRGDLAELPSNSALPRLFHVQIDVPSDAPPGEYTGLLNIRLGELALQGPLNVLVPDVRLPEPGRPIGLYLEPPVHLGWFDATRPQKAEAVACDLQLLRGMGLTGVAPGLATPDAASSKAQFLGGVEQVRSAGFGGPVLAYAPFKRLLAGRGLDAAIQAVDQMHTETTARGLGPVVWSIADEPSNAGHDVGLSDIRARAQELAPGVQFAGHLNHPGDRQYLELLDIVLINEGFGVDQRDIEEVRQAGAKPWLYNMTNRRMAAGFYLWRVGAEGYLQWHGRMPTADPFDPTDGREDDVQLALSCRCGMPAGCRRRSRVVRFSRRGQ
jgi:hypothetical protein